MTTFTILKFSHHSIIMMNASIARFFTFSSTSFRSSIVSHQKSHISKYYMIIKKLFEMFVEKTNRKNRKIIQKKSISSCFFEFRQSHHSIDQLNLKSSNSVNSHRFHSTVYSELTRDHKFFTTSAFSISAFKSMRQLNIVSFTSSNNSITIKSTSTISKFSFYSNIMMKTSMICSFSFSSTSSRLLFLFYTLKVYIIMNDLFVMFAKKQFKKKWNIIHKRMRFSIFD